MLSSNGISDSQRTRITRLRASDNWAQCFVKRNGLLSQVVHGEAGGVHREAVKEGIDVIRKAGSHYTLENIINVDVTGRFSRFFLNAHMLRNLKGRKPFGGTEVMEAKDRISVYLCTNATCSLKVPISMIDKAQNPRCFKRRPWPVKYFAQKNYG